MQNLFGQIWPPIPHMWRTFLHHDFLWKKTGVTRAWRFLRTNKKSHFFGGTLPKICMIITFRWVDKILLRKWYKSTYGSKEVFWYGNNGCHVSQDDLCKFGVALDPWYPGSGSIFMVTWAGLTVYFKKSKNCMLFHSKLFSMKETQFLQNHLSFFDTKRTV